MESIAKKSERLISPDREISTQNRNKRKVNFHFSKIKEICTSKIDEKQHSFWLTCQITKILEKNYDSEISVNRKHRFRRETSTILLTQRMKIKESRRSIYRVTTEYSILIQKFQRFNFHSHIDLIRNQSSKQQSKKSQ